MSSGDRAFYVITGGFLGAVLVAVFIMLRVGPFAPLGPSNADASKVFIVAVASSLGGLGGFTHDVVQNKRFWQRAISTPAGYFLGSRAGILLGVVSGLLVGLLLPSRTAASTAAYAGLTAGISLKGLTEAASGAPPANAPTIALTSDPSEFAKVGGQVTLNVVLKKSDETAAANNPVDFSQSGSGSLDNLQRTYTDANGNLQVKPTAKTQGGVVVTATSIVENQPLSDIISLTIQQ